VEDGGPTRSDMTDQFEFAILQLRGQEHQVQEIPSPNFEV
jgi:hypothetical protein